MLFQIPFSGPGLYTDPLHSELLALEVEAQNCRSDVKKLILHDAECKVHLLRFIQFTLFSAVCLCIA